MSLHAWYEHNSHSLRQAVRRLLDMPIASLVSILVIGVAASLPASLYVLLANANRAASGMRDQAEITVFLRADSSREDAQKLARELARRPDLSKTRVIDKDEGLRSLQSGDLGDLTAGLTDNPLPHAIVALPKQSDAATLDTLAQELKRLPQVEQVIADRDWAKRLDAILRFGEDVVWVLAAALGLALAAVTGNTIRLQIYAARDEIEVSRLIGATERFVRRPFLYFGTLQGLLGGLAAWGMVSGILAIMAGSVARLTTAYGSNFVLIGMGPLGALSLLAISGLLGFIGAFLAVGHTLRLLEKTP